MIFQIFGIFILLAFYGCYFAKMLGQRQKGINTDQLGKGKEGLIKVIEIIMKIATYLVPIFEGISIIFNVHADFVPVWVRNVGIVVALFGVTVFIFSVLTMQDNWRAGVSKTDKTDLVTRGIYQLSRNPAFLGFDLIYIGILMMFFNIPLAAISVFAIIMFHLQIVNVEEVFLLETFGDEYIDYRKKVRRYLGRK